MGVRRLGFCCMCRTLREFDIRCNRDMQQKTWEERGLDYASELSLKNIRDLLTTVQWCAANRIQHYRITSHLMPWFTEYEIDDLPGSGQLRSLFRMVGEVARSNNIRLTFHPSHYVKLASPHEDVVDNSIADLENHGDWCDMMELPRSPEAAINIHIGAHYQSFTDTAERFASAYDRLSDSVSDRLVVENDDSPNLWAVSDLTMVYKRCGVPITYDRHHHDLNPGGQTHKEALDLAVSTWPKDIVPIIHYSEPRDSPPTQAHSEYIDGPIETFGNEVDCTIEAKAKDHALLEYRSGISD